MAYRINLVLATLLFCFASGAFAAGELAVTDLSVSNSTPASLTLTWTAPTGTPPALSAAYYDVRYSTVPITDAASFNAAVSIGGVTAPKGAGGSESLTVGGLACGTGYYFALSALDQSGGSVQSNSVSAATVSCTSSFSVSTAVSGTPTLYNSATGDFNGDGFLDLAYVVHNGGTGNIVFYPGNGSGSFGSPVTSVGVTGNYPLIPTAADVNGDGRLDLLVPNFFGNSVSVLLGNGTGAFTPASPVSSGAEPQGTIGVADVNRDGRLDFVVPLWGGRAAQVFLGDGTGSFTLKGNYGGYPASSRLHKATVADMDRDGLPDIVVADYGITEIGWGTTVGFLKGKGDGSFEDAITHTVGHQPGFLKVHDLNGDGRLDLVAGSEMDRYVSVLIGDGSGGFAAAVNYPVNAALDNCSVTDYNGDGIPDLLVSGPDSSNLYLFTGNGNGTFGSAVAFSLASTPRQLSDGDFNRDGRPDLMVMNTAQNSIYFAANTTTRSTSGHFRTAQTLLTGTNPSSVKVADLNRDGRPDLFTSNEGGNSVSVFYGNGDGSFQNQFVFATGQSPDGIVVGDLNRDGYLDLLAINDPNSFTRNLGSFAGFSGPVNLTLGGANNDDAVLADVNRDGVADLVAVYNAGQDFSRVAVHLGAGDGGFGGRTEFSAGSYANTLASADFNRDGRIDLAVGNFNGNDVSILLGAGDGTFGAPVNYAVTAGPITMTSADFNRDGRPDLAVPNYSGSTVSILLGNGNGSFQPKVDYAAGTNPQTIVSGDIDRDGIADLVVASRGGSSVYLLRGRGDGTFWPAESLTSGASPIYPALADFNGDGRLDIAVANYADSTVSILLNGAPLPTVVQQGLVAHWRGENNALDSIGGNHGVVAGGTDYAQGVVGSAFRFNGTDTSMVNVSHSPSLDITGAITMSAWINLSSLAGYSEILFKGDQNGTPGVQSYALEVTPAGAVTVVLFGSSGDIFTTAPGLITAGQWYHLAATWDGSTSSQDNVKLYRNGSLIQSWTKNSALASTTQSLTIGSHKGLNNTNGLIDEVAIYNRALSAEEIRRVTSSAPNAFSLTPVVNAMPSAAYESNAITVTGITVASPVSISGGKYAVSADGGATWSAWTQASGTADLGDQVKVMLVSSALASSTTTATLTIGGVSADYLVTTTSSPLSPQISLNGLISAWRAENNALDSAGSNSGSLQGAVTYAAGINGGQAFSLNGSDSSIRVAAPSGLPSGAAPRTVAAWIRSAGPTSGTKYQTVFGYGSPGIDGGSFLLEWGGDTNDRRLYLTGWNRDLAGSSQLSYGQWYHVAATYDGATVRLYVNGIEDASAPRSLNTVIGSNYAAIGTSPPNDGWHSFFNGLIDDLSVFDRVLGAAEVATLSGMVPAPFSFAPLVSATLNTEYESAPVQISSHSYAAGISVAGGQYAVSADGTNWGAWSNSAGSVSPGSWVKVKATSSANYGTTTTATLTVGGVSAGFSVKTRNSVIGSAPSGNGSISCESPVDEHGQSICSIIPDYGYHLATLTDNGNDAKGSISQSGNYTIADITANHDVIAGFSINIYTVTATAGANGFMTPSGALPYSHGSSTPLFSIAPVNGYHILSVRKDGEDILVQNAAGFDAPPFTAIVTDHTIEAAFTANLDPGPARTVSPQADYQTLQDAYHTLTTSGDVLLLSTLPGTPAFFATQPKTVWISGGYGSGYSLPGGEFTLLGRFTVSNGLVRVRGVKVR